MDLRYGLPFLAATAATLMLAPHFQAEAATIRSCVKTATGAIRIVGTGVNCQSGEHLVTWNKAGPIGPPGSQGPAGPQGGPGFSSFQTVTAQDAVPAGNIGTVDVACPDGETAISGGFVIPYLATILESHPSPDSASVWRTSAAFPSASGLLTIDVQCAVVAHAVGAAKPAVHAQSRISRLSGATR